MTITDGSTAKDNGFDVVLIDTAGRMQDNEVWFLVLASIPFLNLTHTPASHACLGQASGHEQP
jgi:signal recognition particle GTPase